MKRKKPICLPPERQKGKLKSVLVKNIGALYRLEVFIVIEIWVSLSLFIFHPHVSLAHAAYEDPLQMKMVFCCF